MIPRRPSCRKWRAPPAPRDRTIQRRTPVNCGPRLFSFGRRQGAKSGTKQRGGAAHGRQAAAVRGRAYDQLEMVTYERWCSSPTSSRKTLVLLGRHSAALAGRHIKKHADPVRARDRFAYPIPLRHPREDAMYGTKLDTIREIHRHGAKSPSDVRAAGVRVLRAPPSSRPTWSSSLRAELSTMSDVHGRLNDGSLERLAKGERAAGAALRHYCFDLKIINNDIEDTIAQLKQCVDLVHTKHQWVPVNWVY
uniref:Guanylate kinase-like domain-containing protein n=1 Tax=Macrostomum lignano TaxID=282301 RepID=A0A1I8FBB9_9PLAT